MASVCEGAALVERCFSRPLALDMISTWMPFGSDA
jgi:hypothetical protein